MKNVLILRIMNEPTPYMIALDDYISNVIKCYKREKIEYKSIFNSKPHTQNWEQYLDINLTIVSDWKNDTKISRLIKYLRITLPQIIRSNYVIVPGYTPFENLLTIIFCYILRKPFAIHFDTWKPKHGSQIYTSIKRWIFKNADILLAGGTPQKEFAAGLAGENVFIAPLTVDIQKIMNEVAQRHSQLSKNGQIIILYVGRLTPEKDLATLIKAFSIVSESYNMVKLRIVGDGPEKDSLRNLAGKNINIEFLGFLEYDGIIDQYAQADIFVLPSKYEPWGLVINEAMAAGLPVVVSSKVGCIRDLVVNSVTGYIFTSGNYEELAHLLIKLIENNDLRNQIGKNAQRFIIENWSFDRWDKIINRIIEQVK